jgi:hypothetical protein
MFDIIKTILLNWLTLESPPSDFPLCDFERIRYEVRPCDVLLIEGRSHVSEVIQYVTQSPWTHAGLYIGRLHDIDNIRLRNRLSDFFKGEPNEQLIIEGYVGKGTVVNPMSEYINDHIRICRPRGLSRLDAQRIIEFSVQELGKGYDVRQVWDLMRYLFPWMILPKRWRSSIFEYTAGETTRTICSTMIAEAFTAVNFPILPLVKQHEETGIELIRRNPRLYTPKDFDYSPYFDIIKYPFVAFADHAAYHDLPWNKKGLIHNDKEGIYDPNHPIEALAEKSALPAASIKKKKRKLFGLNLKDTSKKKSQNK